MRVQNNNRQICYDSLKKYGVRECVDPTGYHRALLANHPELVERQKALNRERYANDPEYALRKNAECREYYAKNAEQERSRGREYYAAQKAKGLVYRKGSDGKKHWVLKEN